MKVKFNLEVFFKVVDVLKMKLISCIVFEDVLVGIEVVNIVGMISIGIGDKFVLSDV